MDGTDEAQDRTVLKILPFLDVLEWEWIDKEVRGDMADLKYWSQVGPDVECSAILITYLIALNNNPMWSLGQEELLFFFSLANIVHIPCSRQKGYKYKIVHNCVLSTRMVLGSPLTF